MTARTPLSRTEGLGAAHSGVKHFWRQRVTAAALIPLSVWFAWFAFSLIGTDRDSAAAFLKLPMNAVLMGLFIVMVAIHMALGIRVVIDDYVYRRWQKVTLLVLNQFFSWIVTAVALYALIKIAL